MKRLSAEFFSGDTLSVARNLLGCKIVYNECEGIIVETEAYKTDEASHFHTKKVKGTALSESYGQIYIYLNYGMYHMLNFTTEKSGVGAVLVRAVEPTSGLEIMKMRRKTDLLQNLTNGPGKLCMAFGIDMSINGIDVGNSLNLYDADSREFSINTSPRIGISRAVDLPWRFYIADNKFVSKYKPYKEKK